jgi:hypothetical protein
MRYAAVQAERVVRAVLSWFGTEITPQLRQKRSTHMWLRATRYAERRRRRAIAWAATTA